MCFLTWYFLNAIQKKKIIAPLSTAINLIAEIAYTLFDREWENAPENDFLKELYLLDKDVDYYDIREYIDKIIFQSYLFYPDAQVELRNVEQEVIEDSESFENLIPLLNESRDTLLNILRTSLLAFSGKEWAAKILGESHPLYEDILNISKKIKGLFLYKGQDDENIFIEHIASGKAFNMAKKSFDYSTSLKEIDTILYLGIVKWLNEWWFSGVFFQQEYNANLVQEEKNSIKSKAEVNFLVHQEQNITEILKKQFDAFMDFTHQRQIVFINSNEIDSFMRKYTDHFNTYLRLSKEEIEQARHRSAVDNLNDFEKNRNLSPDDTDQSLIFFNPHSGAEVAFGICSAFPLPHNPYYKEDESKKHLINLLVSEESSKELALYCINNCKDDLAFFKEDTGKLYLDHIDFLLRFWKRSLYYPVPSVSFSNN